MVNQLFEGRSRINPNNLLRYRISASFGGGQETTTEVARQISDDNYPWHNHHLLRGQPLRGDKWSRDQILLCWDSMHRHEKERQLNYLIGDHLGSTSLMTDASGNVVSRQQYKAWGETRSTSGSEMTKYQYTGQYSNTADFGLMYYNARWYDPYLNHFTQPDTIIPSAQLFCLIKIKV